MRIRSKQARHETRWAKSSLRGGQPRRARQTQDQVGQRWTGNTSGACPTVDQKRGKSRPNNNPHHSTLPRRTRINVWINVFFSRISFDRWHLAPRLLPKWQTDLFGLLTSPVNAWPSLASSIYALGIEQKNQNGPADGSLLRLRCWYHLTVVSIVIRPPLAASLIDFGPRIDTGWRRLTTPSESSVRRNDIEVCVCAYYP